MSVRDAPQKHISGMKVIAQRGNHSQIVVETKPGMGHMIDLETGRCSPEMAVESFIARGYWEPATTEGIEIARSLLVAGEPSPQESISSEELPGEISETDLENESDLWVDEDPQRFKLPPEWNERLEAFRRSQQGGAERELGTEIVSRATQLGVLTERFVDYAENRLTWDELKEFVANFPLAHADRNPPAEHDARYDWAEEQAWEFTKDSWDAVDRARAHNYITTQEYIELAHAVSARLSDRTASITTRRGPIDVSVAGNDPDEFVFARDDWYGTDRLIVLSREAAEYWASFWRSVKASKTWNDFFKAIEQLDRGEHERLQEWWRTGEHDNGDDWYELSAPVDFSALPGVDDSDWPPMLEQVMIHDLPKDVLELAKYGTTVLNGEFVQLSSDCQGEVVDVLAKSGHRCSHEPELLRAASGYEVR